MLFLFQDPNRPEPAMTTNSLITLIAAIGAPGVTAVLCFLDYRGVIGHND